MKITGFPDKSVSYKAGLEEGDIITGMDGRAVTSIEDVKIELFYKKKGDVVMVTVLRDDDDGKDEITFKVRL